VAGLLLWGRLAAAQTEPPAPLPPETVALIEIRSEIDLTEESLDDLQRLITFSPGDPLTEDEIARTLRNVQASGIASEVELYTRPAGAGEGGTGVVAMLVLRPVVRVAEVRLEGELGIEEGDLRRRLLQNPAEPLNEEKVVQGVFQLLDLYEARGYFDADVRVRVNTDPRSREAVVIYHAASGPRAKIGTIDFRGSIEPFAAPALIEHLDLKPGAAYGRRSAREDAERLQTWLIRQGYRTARVDTPEVAKDPETQTVRLVYPIEVGSRIELKVIGAEEKQLRRKGLLPFLGDQGFDEALVLQSTQRLKDFYQRQGHHGVKIDWQEQQAAGVQTLTLRIEPGPESTLQEIDFTGNQAFDDERLAQLMTTAGRSLLNLGSGRLVDSELQRDLDNIRSFYALQGYGQAEVGPPLVEEREREIRLEIPIVEGPRQQVMDLRFEGVEALDLDALQKTLPLTAGGPFHPFLLERTLDGLRQAYRDKGYGEAQVSAGVTWNEDKTLADVTVRVLEGEQMILDRVIVRGNQRTESAVIQRTLGVKPGDPISETRRLEIERDLYRLGIFSSVQVELSRAGPESAARDLIVRVEEGLPRRVSYSLGVEYGSGDQDKFRPRGGFSFVHNNVAGRAWSLRTDLRAELDQNSPDLSFRVLFDQPYAGRYPVPLTYSLFGFREGKDAYDVERWGGRVEAAKLLTDRRVSLIYDYRIVDTTPKGIVVPLSEREDRPYQLSSLIPSFLWDRRNDPVLATRGWSSFAQLQWTFPALGTDGDFLKLFLQQTQYVGLNRYGVLAASVRVGGIEPFGDLPDPDLELPPELPNSDVFIDERLFAGGATTHRAFGLDKLGIRGETVRVSDQAIRDNEYDVRGLGGNGLLLVNLEYRFPIAGPFEGVAFYDAGNVWPDWRQIDPSDVKSGVGLGVRWLSPIGPLRVDAGWKLHPEYFEESEQLVFQLSFGNPF
jgi:outer membrane protein insertion porin family